MNCPVVVLRPEPGCSDTLAALREHGLEAVAAPLFEIEPVDWTPPNAGRIDALLIGSANVFRHGGRGLDGLRDFPVWAVGSRTAAAAQDAGFSVARTGSGGLQNLLREAQAPLAFLRLAGEARIDLVAPVGVTVVERTVYRAAPRPLAEEAVAVLHGGAVAALHSAAAARRFAGECERLSIPREDIAIAAFGQRIADAAGPGWKCVRAAGDTSDSALLALLDDMCH